MADDIASRLAAALDRAETEVRAGRSDGIPTTVLRLIERDRVLLDRYESARGRRLAWVKFEVLHGEVQCAAAFWGVPDA